MLALITIMIIAFGLMLGFLSPSQALRKIGRLIAAMLFFPLVLALFFRCLHQVPAVAWIPILIVGIPACFLLGIRLLFGRRPYEQMLGHIAYDGFRYLLRGMFLGFVLLGRVISGAISRARSAFQRP